MRTPAHVLVVDDNAANVDILKTRLSFHGYEVFTAMDGEEALRVATERLPDLILLDIMMPKVNGVEVCRRLRSDDSLPFIPIIVVSAKSDSGDVAEALDAGADEYLTKPIDQTALVARVKSMLRIKSLQDRTVEQAKRVEAQAAELGQWNQRLEARVSAQLAELERMSQLKQFFSPQLADAIVSAEGENLLQSHRREITVLFCDLREFTIFSSTAEPEVVVDVLREYHHIVGLLLHEYEATLEHIAGDGLMVFFNDPVPCPDPTARAVRMAVAMREQVRELLERWSRRGFQLGFGVGISVGYATLGQIGFRGQFHYAAIGSVANLAARLCDRAEDGQILITQPVYADVEDMVEVEALGEVSLKGFLRPVPVLHVKSLRA